MTVNAKHNICYKMDMISYINTFLSTPSESWYVVLQDTEKFVDGGKSVATE